MGVGSVWKVSETFWPISPVDPFADISGASQNGPREGAVAVF